MYCTLFNAHCTIHAEHILLYSLNNPKHFQAAHTQLLECAVNAFALIAADSQDSIFFHADASISPPPPPSCLALTRTSPRIYLYTPHSGYTIRIKLRECLLYNMGELCSNPDEGRQL